ncbi:hypothetical protein M407DRAFT_4014 [Tulasnella calospora MUT 4182]|uniref:Uncharacterized protein n=1 Tax=Tulasnella calospora MUT 4182 TaxID=1051891 RepID=A0A0C3QX15_9AGAM|nr:hypothetical protein M407DRAFT_4014 [Tulasnella calospora MUT 4182]
MGPKGRTSTYPIGIVDWDSKMIHLLLVETVKEMWDVLVAAKESQGTMRVLTLRRRFFWSPMEEGAEMVAHIAVLSQVQSNICLMGEKVNDDEFLAVLTTSLPESWDMFVQAYFGATNGVTMDPSGGMKKITSQELATVLTDKDRHW